MQSFRQCVALNCQCGSFFVRFDEKTARKEKEKQEPKEVKKDTKEESNAKRAAEKLAEKVNKIAARFQKYVSRNTGWVRLIRILSSATFSFELSRFSN